MNGFIKFMLILVILSTLCNLVGQVILWAPPVVDSDIAQGGGSGSNGNNPGNNGNENKPGEEEVQKPVANVQISASVTPDENGQVPAGGVTMNGETASANVPEGVQMAEGATELTLTVNGVEDSAADLNLNENEVATSLDVHMAGVSTDNAVPMEVKLLAAMVKGLNSTSIKLYHVENGETVEMTRVANNEEFTAHNQFKYDPATGDVTLYIAGFSEIAMIADTVNAWEGELDYTWYTEAAEGTTEYTISNAEQLAALSAIVGGMKKVTGRVDGKYTYSDEVIQDSFEGKTITLLADINLGDDEENNNSNIIFHPIGYWNNEGTYERKPIEERTTAVSSGFYTFNGTFDGNGHTIANFYQNTWEMKGDHDWYNTTTEQYFRDGMGLFGRLYKATVKNLTIKNFSSDGEITTTGCVAAYADGATLENIAIFNCNPRVYNIGNGGIVGCVGWYAKEANLKTTFTNITVDNTNKISALWGSYDVACGGIVGQYYPTSGQTSANKPANGGISFENCHVSAIMDVYNDVCANYQYYAYRYTGMLIGSVRENVTIDGRSYPKMDGITASGCTVHYGTWNDYYYCEIVANSLASYTHDHQFSRLTQVAKVDVENKKYLPLGKEDIEINYVDIPSGWAHYVVVNGDHASENATCYHFNNGAVWNHEDAGTEIVNGDEVLKEDKQHIYLEFNNLVTGYGWGVTSKGVGDLAGVTILDRENPNSVEKFEGKVNSLDNTKEYTLGDIFSFIDNGVELIPDALTVGITNLDENGNVVATITYDVENWANGTIIFSGVGSIQITIQDYYFCIPTTIIVNIAEHEHEYDNNCDVDCNECGAIRTPEEHIYDNDCDVDCNECGATRDVGEHTYDNACDTTCNECDEIRTIEHKPGVAATCTIAQTCTVCGAELNAALGHTEVVDAAVAPTCTETGLTEGKHCSVCNEVLTAQTVIEKLGHKPGEAATCTTAQTCTVCSVVIVKALGHNYESVVTNPTCTTAGYTTHTCSKCSETNTDNHTEALGHITKKFESDAFTYRIGNQNAVELSSLFNIGNRTVTVAGTNTGNASVAVNSTTLKFSGTGVVEVTLTSSCTCGECELTLNLEVVDAVNANSATNATSNNVVLLNDAEFSSLEVSGGYTLYGNGFTLTCGSDSAVLDFSSAFVKLDSGILDNVQIVCPNFDYAALYKTNLTSSDNRSQTTDKTRYFNAMSGVIMTGNSQILNSRISGGRAAVLVSSGNAIIDNSRIELGAVASILISSANSVVLRDITLVQKPTASTYDSSKTLMGFSILVTCDANGYAPKLTLEGTITQEAWANEEHKKYVPSAGQSLVSTVLKQNDFIHSVNGKNSLNLGLAYIPEDISLTGATPVNDPIADGRLIDNRTNKTAIPYSLSSKIDNKFYVYSYNNSNGTDETFKNAGDYIPNKYGDIITVNYSDHKDGLEQGKSFGTSGWVYELNVDLDKASGYKLDFSKLSMVVNGVVVNDYKVNGGNKPSTVAATAGGVTYTLTATIDGKEYTATFKVTGTETSKESPSLVSANYQAGLCVASSYGGTWHGAAPALEGVVIKYWSVAESKYIELDLGNISIGKGQLNGTNTTWTYTPANGDYTLTLTGGQVHSSNNVYAMPVGVDGTLYFVASASKGLVNSGNSARTVPVSYSFKDNNGGDVLTFSHTWSVAENRDEQYNYSDFCKGTLTKLESSSGGGSCVTPDTLITLADGSQVRVDSLTGDELLLVWNMETGKLGFAPIMFVDSESEAEFEVIKLYFSDGTEVKVIAEHGFWDYDLNKYVYLDRYADKYIGHTFAKQNGDSLEKVTLVDVVLETEITTAWSPVTVGHLCYFVNGMLSMPGGVGGLFNIFEVDAETMTYDYEQISKDIETYGLFTYEELNAICPLTEDMFNAAGGAYLKISIGKGNLTVEELINMINRYSKYI